ncbi:hypothetical protein COBT_003663, partial [Conglomerata obtusa]
MQNFMQAHPITNGFFILLLLYRELDGFRITIKDKKLNEQINMLQNFYKRKKNAFFCVNPFNPTTILSNIQSNIVTIHNSKCFPIEIKFNICYTSENCASQGDNNNSISIIYKK